MSLKSRIYAYLQKNPNEWIPSAQIERLAFENTTYIASNAARRLRELHEANPEKIQRKHEHGIAYYKYIPSNYEVFHQQQLLAN